MLNPTTALLRPCRCVAPVRLQGKYIVHQEYSTTLKTNDIALIILDEAIDSIVPVSLANAKQVRSH